MRVVVDQIPEKCKECLFYGAYRFETVAYGNGHNRYGCILLKEELRTKGHKKIPGCPLVTADQITNREVTENGRK